MPGRAPGDVPGDVQAGVPGDAPASAPGAGVAGLPRGILAGVRVLDVGRYIAGPFCAAMLADLGADVVRVEWPGRDDDRFVMPAAPGGEGALHLQVNRGKRSVALDLGHPASAEPLRRLVSASDVVVANLPRRARLRLGLDYDALRAVRPDVVLTTITAFDADGAHGEAVGFDGTGQALSGALFLTGTPEQPFRSGVSFVDYATAASAAFGTVAALLGRLRTGEGRHVECSLLGTALTMTNPMLIEEAMGARHREASGNRSPIAGPSDLFRARDGWVLVQVIGREMFGRWAALVEAPELLEDPRLADDIGRGEHGALLSARMSAWTATRTVEQCLEALGAARVPGCRLHSPAEALAMAGVEGALHWTAAGVPVVRPPARLSGQAPWRPADAPGSGAHTAEVLGGLGFTAGEIGALAGAGCIVLPGGGA